MPEPASVAADLSAPDDLISFLKAIPDGRYRRGVRYPQWFLLLVGVLGILRGCRNSRGLEAFAKRHREVLNQALGLNFKRWPSDATLLYLFNKAHLQEFGQVLQAWMISQIPGGAEGLDQLVCDGKILRGSAIETEDGNNRFVAQVTVYARALGVALAQTTYDTHESSEKAALKELLSTLDLNGVLIQADALHTTQAFFAGAWSRVRPAVDRQIQPKDPVPADRLPVRGKAQDPFHGNGYREAPRTPDTLGTQGQRGARSHQDELAGQRLDRGGHHLHHDPQG